MLKLQQLRFDRLREDREANRAGYVVFMQKREVLSNHWLEFIRLRNRAKVLGIPVSEDVHLLALWLNAAQWLLEVADEELQSEFLLSSMEDKDRFVEAILKDGGLHDADGRWVTVPLLS